MPNTTKPLLLAAVLQIPGDPFLRSMGILISIDGQRCISEFVLNADQARDLLGNPIYRERFKAQGFDLYKEPFRWVLDPTHDQEYIAACAAFRRDWEKAKSSVIKKDAEIKAAPHN